MSPSPRALQDTWLTEPIVKCESIVTGISVSDLGKRRIWLGGPGETKNYTEDPDQTEQKDVTKRQKRARRAHEMLYSLRIF